MSVAVLLRSGRVAWIGFNVFITYVISYLLRFYFKKAFDGSESALKTALADLVFVCRHVKGLEVDTHFFYLDAQRLLDARTSKLWCLAARPIGYAVDFQLSGV